MRLKNVQNDLTLFRLGGGGRGGRHNPYYSRTMASTVFVLRDFSSNLPRNNLVLSSFGS